MRNVTYFTLNSLRSCNGLFVMQISEIPFMSYRYITKRIMYMELEVSSNWEFSGPVVKQSRLV